MLVCRWLPAQFPSSLYLKGVCHDWARRKFAHPKLGIWAPVVRHLPRHPTAPLLRYLQKVCLVSHWHSLCYCSLAELSKHL